MPDRFSDIWERHEPWPEGRAVLEQIVMHLRGRHIVAEVRAHRPDVVSLNLPMPRTVNHPVLGEADLGEVLSLHTLPVLIERGNAVMARHLRGREGMLEKHLDRALTSDLLARINTDLADDERGRKYREEPELWMVAADEFGLPDPLGPHFARFEAVRTHPFPSLWERGLGTSPLDWEPAPLPKRVDPC